MKAPNFPSFFKKPKLINLIIKQDITLKKKKTENESTSIEIMI